MKKNMMRMPRLEIRGEGINENESSKPKPDSLIKNGNLIPEDMVEFARAVSSAIKKRRKQMNLEDPTSSFLVLLRWILW